MPSSELESPEEELDPTDVPPHLRREYLIEAGLLNLGVLVTAVGLLVLGFTDKFAQGAGFLIFGAVLLLATAWRYRRHAPP